MEIKKRIYLYLFLLIIAVVTMVMLRQTIRRGSQKPYLPRDFREIKASGTMKVVTDYNTIGYFISGDSIRGFQVEMMQALEKEWGIKVELLLENRLKESLEGLWEQQYDLVARNIPVNIALKDSFAFTRPITLNKQVLVQRKAAYNNGIEPIRRHLNLAKKTIVLPAGSPAILRLNNLSHEIGDTILIREEPLYETEQLVMLVASGNIDFTVCDEKVAERLSETIPEIDIETDISFTQLESWAVRKDAPVLLDSLNRWLDRFQKTKQFKRLYRKYYHDT